MHTNKDKIRGIEIFSLIRLRLYEYHKINVELVYYKPDFLKLSFDNLCCLGRQSFREIYAYFACSRFVER
jgi:hypothetical protein